MTQKRMSILAEQEFDATLCTGISTLTGGSEGIGFRVEAYDPVSGETIEMARGSIDVPGKGGSSSSSEHYSCFMTDSKSSFAVTMAARGFLPIEGLPIEDIMPGKMYLIRVPMKQKPECFYDQEKFADYNLYISSGFGIPSEDYELECMDSDFTRGGFISAEGRHIEGANFKLDYHWGWCSSGGSDCGFSKCFASGSDDPFYAQVKERICNDLSSAGRNDGNICTAVAYDNTSQVRQLCMEGLYEKREGNIAAISVRQDSGRCSSSVDAGDFKCLDTKMSQGP
jgi:hypothetical protein